MIMFIIVVGAITWGIGGAIGGIVTAMVVHRQEKSMLAKSARDTSATLGTVLGWIFGLALGGATWFVTAGILNVMMHTIVNRPMRWGWGIIPETIGLGIGGAVAGAIGSRFMLTK